MIIPERFLLDIITNKSGQNILRVDERFLKVLNLFTRPKAYCDGIIYDIEGPYKDTVVTKTKLVLLAKEYDLSISKNDVTKFSLMINRI